MTALTGQLRASQVGWLLLVGCLSGFFSGLFGVGGGLIIVPGLVVVLGMEQRRAVGTSLLAIVPAIAVGVAAYAYGGSVDVVAGGLLSLIRPGTSRASIVWALFTAVTIAAYTLVDSQGSRVSHEIQGADIASVRYSFALMPLAAIGISVANVIRGRTDAFVASVPANWKRYTIAAIFLTAAYTLVLVAVLSAPVGYVTMLRESSVVMGALAGWLFLHEKMGKSRVVSSLIIVTGLVLLILTTL